jgi:uncharacterized protein (TIGR02145 family)
MKKILLFFLPLWGSGGLFGGFAFAQVSVAITGTTYSASTPQVSCIVSWTATSSTPYNNKIWVIADYVKVQGTSTVAPWSRATVTAVSKAAGAGTVSTAPESNNLGFLLTTPGGNGSATVTATLGLPAGVAQFNWCAYAFDYPPHAVLQPDGTYQLHGTKPFNINGSNLAADAATYSGASPIITVSDASNWIWYLPGINQPQGSCTFTQPAAISTFATFPSNYAASTFITLNDERDGKNYAVVKMPDGKWWMAQNLNYQLDLVWNRNSNEANGTGFTSTTNGIPAIGSFWCPAGVDGATATVSSANRAGCTLYGALYTYETAMMLDGKWSDESHNSSNFVEPTYSAETTTGNTINSGRGATKRGICPLNWHVPTDAEWGIMMTLSGTKGSNYNNGYDVWIGNPNDAGEAGARLKTKCTCPSINTNCVDDANDSYLYDPCTTCIGYDAYGFRAMPAGHRWRDGSNYNHRGINAGYWASTAISSYDAWARGMNSYSSGGFRGPRLRAYGFAVRCVRD